MSECYASREKWSRTRDEIARLQRRARRLVPRADYLLRRELWYVLQDLEILMDDLHAWRPTEEVCWGEFDRKLRNIKARLDSIERQMRLRVRV